MRNLDPEEMQNLCDTAPQRADLMRAMLDTDDLVTLHEDGFISFASRDKDMLKVGGENVAAIEVIDDFPRSTLEKIVKIQLKSRFG